MAVHSFCLLLRRDGAMINNTQFCTTPLLDPSVRDGVTAQSNSPVREEKLQKKYFTTSQRRRNERKISLAKKKLLDGDKKPEKDNCPLIIVPKPALQTLPNKVSVNLDIKVTASSLGNKVNSVLNNPSKSDEKINSADKMDSKNSEKSREEIMAEREAKKIAKQMAKTKNKSSVPDKPETKKVEIKKSGIESDRVNNKKPENVNKVMKEQVETVTKQVAKCDIKNTTVITPEPQKNISKTDQLSDNKDAKRAEKSRDEVKADREAKKLAKQTKTNNKGSVDAAPKEAAKVTVQVVSDNKTSGVHIQELDKNIPIVETVDTQVQKTEKTKSELKAERRAKQEAQRAAKESQMNAKISSNETKKTKVLPAPTATVKKVVTLEKTKQHKVKLFNHLYGEKEATHLVPFIPLNSKEIHPAIVRLGVQYASHVIMGSNARCIALLNALKQVIQDYVLPPNAEFYRKFEEHLAPCINFLKSCRPPAVSMNNAIKHITSQLTQLPNNITEIDAKQKLNDTINTYISDQIEAAGRRISIDVYEKISNGDVILTYGCSSLVENILKRAAETKNFRVVVVAAHPWNEGKEMLRRLTLKKVKCSLIMISALSFVMRGINKVILGAGALLANGYVMARAGTAQVAMVANAHNVPVLVCCETYKFSERVQTDSFVYNEIGDPDDLIKCDPSHQDSPLLNWRAHDSLTLLNLTYDVTPPDLVTAVVTERSILPCTSVPVILRIKPSELY